MPIERTFKKHPLALAMAGTFVSALGAVGAALYAPGAYALEEVVVTAQRREESLQDVPIAVSALSADSIEQLGISSISRFEDGQVPSLRVYRFAGRANELVISIRGINVSDSSQPSFERPVALYVDGVLNSRGQSSAVDLLDLERVEILRGPQGTLFGRNAMAGAVSLTTKKPTGELGFKQTFEAGRFDRWHSKTTINLPEWYGLSTKIDFLNKDWGGWIENLDSRYDDFGSQRTRGGAVTLRYKPVEDWTVDYKYMTTGTRFVQGYNTLQLVQSRAVAAGTTPWPMPVTTDRPDQSWTGIPTGTAGDTSHNRLQQHDLTLQWNVSDELTVKSITSWGRMNSLEEALQGGTSALVQQCFGQPGIAVRAAGQPCSLANGTLLTALPSFGVTGVNSGFQLENTTFSQEVQIIGNRERLEYAVGVAYFKEEFDVSTWSNFGLLFTAPGQLPGVLPATCAPTANGIAKLGFTMYNCDTPVNLGNAAGAPFGSTQRLKNNTIGKSTALGLYGQATWTPPILDDKVKLTLGLRYSDDEKDLTRLVGQVRGGQTVGTPIFNATGGQIGTVAPATISTPTERVDPAVTLDYSWTPEISTYFRYATAYRGGGASIRQVEDFVAADADDAETFEAGWKMQLLDNRLRWNGAIFHTTWNLEQLTVQTVSVASTQLINVPDPTTFWGMENEWTWQPLDNLTLNAAYTFIQHDQPPGPARVINNPTTGQAVLSGSAPIFTPLVPDHAWSLSGDYTIPEFMGIGDLRFHVDYSASTEYAYNPVSFDLIQGGDYGLTNLRVTLSNIDLGGGKLSIAGWVNNVFDEEYVQFGYTTQVPGGEPVSATDPRLVRNGVGIWGDPITYGVTAVYQWGK
ncbi:MAG: TonB-dependent receptor [Gammaproteobacteria bacterium]